MTSNIADVVSDDASYCNNEAPFLMEAQTNSGNITWYADEELNEILSTEPTLAPSNTLGSLTYYVTSTENNCESLPNNVIIEIIECGIIVPTAFTPDGDNVNDFWSLENIDEIYPNNKVFIYNRWGNIIFESQAGSYEQYPWSGTFNGEKLPVGSFYYIIDYNDGYTDTSNGTVSILK